MSELWNKKRVSSDYVPSDILTCNDTGVVCKYMHYFILEVQREDGKPYPSGTILTLQLLLKFVGSYLTFVFFCMIGLYK